VSEHPLDPVFHPRAIALVGVPEQLDGRGADFFLALLDQGFHERKPVYVVHPRAQAIRGIRAYPTLLACPDPVDHVISLIPRHLVSTLVDQCVEKRVRSLHFFTAGFSESGEEDMAAAERELAARARAGGVRVLGPNCMGLYIPEERIRKFALVECDASGVMTSIVEKPDEATYARLANHALVSMNLWSFSPVIFEACRRVLPSERGELELQDAVRIAMRDLGERFEVIPFAGGVLDLSSRRDVAAVSERLATTAVRL